MEKSSQDFPFEPTYQKDKQEKSTNTVFRLLFDKIPTFILVLSLKAIKDFVTSTVLDHNWL